MDSVTSAEKARGEPGYTLLTLLSLSGWQVEIVRSPGSRVLVRALLPGTRCCISQTGDSVADVAVDVVAAALARRRLRAVD